MTTTRLAALCIGALLLGTLGGCSSFGPGDDAAVGLPTREATPTDPASPANGPADGTPAATPPSAAPSPSGSAPGTAPAGTPAASGGGCTSVTRTPSVVEEESFDTADRPWLDPSDARTADGQGASVEFYGSNSVSSSLHARSFGLGIPAGATIKGIVLQMKRSTTGTQVEDLVLFLVDLGAPGTGLKGTSVMTQFTNDYSKQGNWPSGGYKTATYGSATDMWGATLNAAKLNAASFGVHFAISNWGPGSVTAHIDAVTMTVHYCQ